mmetsp:Transcript_30127/g.62104  ORF Transcript_30127/g.62104 Transcript_30127/m.62104 type:complete len:269 (-) Transcript_30127:374-1180(-)
MTAIIIFAGPPGRMLHRTATTASPAREDPTKNALRAALAGRTPPATLLSATAPNSKPTPSSRPPTMILPTRSSAGRGGPSLWEIAGWTRIARRTMIARRAIRVSRPLATCRILLKRSKRRRRRSKKKRRKRWRGCLPMIRDGRTFVAFRGWMRAMIVRLLVWEVKTPTAPPASSASETPTASTTTTSYPPSHPQPTNQPTRETNPKAPTSAAALGARPSNPVPPKRIAKTMPIVRWVRLASRTFPAVTLSTCSSWRRLNRKPRRKHHR